MTTPNCMDASTPTGTAYNFFKALAQRDFCWARNLTQLWWARKHGYEYTPTLLEETIAATLCVKDVVWVKEKPTAPGFNPLIVADCELLLETYGTFGNVVVSVRLVREIMPRSRQVHRWKYVPFIWRTILIPRPHEEGCWGVNPASLRITP